MSTPGCLTGWNIGLFGPGAHIGSQCSVTVGWDYFWGWYHVVWPLRSCQVLSSSIDRDQHLLSVHVCDQYPEDWAWKRFWLRLQIPAVNPQNFPFVLQTDERRQDAFDNQLFEWMFYHLESPCRESLLYFQPVFTGDFYSNEFQCLCETEQIKEALLCPTAACLSICNHRPDTNPHTVWLRVSSRDFPSQNWLLFSLIREWFTPGPKGEHCWTADTVQSVEVLLLPKRCLSGNLQFGGCSLF